MADETTSSTPLTLTVEAFHTSMEAKINDLVQLSENHHIEKKEREHKLEVEVNAICKELNDFVYRMEQPMNAKDRAWNFFLQGKALLTISNYDQRTENVLAKAIKLDPSLIEAWNCLGECFWRKDDLEGARNCFVGAMEQAKTVNKVSLRQLSMVLRLLSVKNGSNQLIEESVKKAKEAVSLDVTDGMSWYILGNAYLSNFFCNSNDPNDIKLSLKAYQQAEANSNSKRIPDLYFNRAKIFKYQEEYQKALDDFQQSANLDPEFEEPHKEIKEIVDFVEKAVDQINKRGSLKSKKLAQMVKSIPESAEQIPISSLNVGANTDKCIVGRVVAPIPKSFIPKSVYLVDKEGAFVPVSVYNVADEGIHANDMVVIPDPFVKSISIQFNGKALRYDCIQADYRKMTVNGKLDKMFVAETSLTITKGFQNDKKKPS